MRWMIRLKRKSVINKISPNYDNYMEKIRVGLEGVL